MAMSDPTKSDPTSASDPTMAVGQKREARILVPEHELDTALAAVGELQASFDAMRALMDERTRERDAFRAAMRQADLDLRTALYYAGADWGEPASLAHAVSSAAEAVRERDHLRAKLERVSLEVIGACTAAGSYMLVDADPVGPGEVTRAIKRIAEERDRLRVLVDQVCDELDIRDCDDVTPAQAVETLNEQFLAKCKALDAVVREAWSLLNLGGPAMAEPTCQEPLRAALKAVKP